MTKKVYHKMTISQDKTSQSSAISNVLNALESLKTTHKDIDAFMFYYNNINNINKDKNTDPAPLFGVIENDGIKSTYQAFVAQGGKTKNKVVILGGGAEIKARIDDKNGVNWVVVAYNTMKKITKEFTLKSLSYQDFSNGLESIHLVNLMGETDFKHYKQHLHAKKNIDVIRSVDFIGYDKESGCYVYPNFYIDPKGAFHTATTPNYYNDIGVLIQKSDYSHGTITPRESVAPKDLINNVFSLYGVRGVTPLMYFVASKFRHLFIDNQEFNYFPFLSFYGTAQNGKSALMKALNGLNFQDGEGIQANLSDTAKGIQRRLSQYSGQATVIAELQKGAKFSVDTLLGAYNGGGLGTRAIKDNSNMTSSVELNCGLVVAVNHELATTKQAKERFISVKYDLATRQALGEIKDADALKMDKDFMAECRAFNNACEPQKIAQVGRWILENRAYFEANLLERSKNCYAEIVDNVQKEGGAYDDRAVKHLALCLGAFYLVFELMNDALSPTDKDMMQRVQVALITDMTRLVMERVKTAKHDTQALDLFVQKLIDYIEKEGHIHDKKSRVYKENGILYFSKSKAYDALDARNNTVMHDRIDKELPLAEYVKEINKGVKIDGDNQRMVLIDIQKFTMR